jgi:hypothetical protein
MAAHVANLNDSETHSDEDESDGGLDDLLGIGSLDCASESEEDEAPLFARRDADLGALLDADRYFAVVDGAVDAAALASALEDLEAVDFTQHRFVFERKKYDKPGIFEADLTGDCADAPPRLVRLLKRFGAELADALPVPCARAAAIKVQRNDGGAFPAHYDNAGPPSKRAVTAVLYFGAEAGGDLVLAPFLRRGVAVSPRRNRLALFRSDRVLHWVTPWTGKRPRYCVSFWFDGAVNAPEDTLLTKDALRFPDWDACAAFFTTSPLQRAVSRAVYEDDYAESLAACVRDAEAYAAMAAGHERAVAGLEGQLLPLITELRRRKALLEPPEVLA